MLCELGLVGGIREVEMRGFLLDAEVFITDVFRLWGRAYACMFVLLKVSVSPHSDSC